MSRYDLTDFEWRVIEPLMPNKPRGVPRVDDRRVLNGIFWVLRSGAPWRHLPERYGPRTTCYNRIIAQLRWCRGRPRHHVIADVGGRKCFGGFLDGGGCGGRI
jgi:transposase